LSKQQAEKKTYYPMHFGKYRCKIRIIPLLWFFATISFSQNTPTKFAVTAQKLAKYGKISEAISNWKQDYQISHDHWNAQEIAALYAIGQSIDSAFVWLYIATKNDSSLSIFEDARFYAVLETPNWAAFEAQLLNKYEYKNGKLRNRALVRELCHINMKDQAYSYEINLGRRVLGDTSPIVAALWKLQEMNREENLTAMEAIIDKYGWPKKSEVGETAASAAFYIVQHSMGEKARKKYLPQLKKACAKNEASWTDYAAMYDRLSLAEKGTQLYGTQFGQLKLNGPLELLPLSAPEYVEKRRKEIGLPPLIPILEKQGIAFKVVQKE
jgi:hypothetical protein